MIDGLKPVTALYMGGMGAKDQNFHKQVFERMGYADVADEVQKLYLEGRKDEAAALSRTSSSTRSTSSATAARSGSASRSGRSPA